MTAVKRLLLSLRRGNAEQHDIVQSEKKTTVQVSYQTPKYNVVTRLLTEMLGNLSEIALEDPVG